MHTNVTKVAFYYIHVMYKQAGKDKFIVTAVVDLGSCM